MSSRRVAPALLFLSLIAVSVLGIPTTVVAQGGPCQDGGFNNTWVGANKDPAGGATSYVTAIKASYYIPSSSHWYACSLNGVGNDGPSTWVAIDPGSGNPVHSFNTILQVGVVRCTIPIVFPCLGAVPHLVWADGGCGGDTPVYDDLGNASWSTTYNFEISKVGNNYELKVNDLTRVSISKNNAHISCWIQSDTKADWAQERFDRGDSAGSNAATSQRVQISSMRYATPANNVWLNPSITTCYNTYDSGPGRYVWSVQAGDAFHAWTLNP